MKQQELLDNRNKWIKALLYPSAKKTTGVLEQIDYNGEVVGRCCLGTGCSALGVKRIMGDMQNVGYYDGEDDGYSVFKGEPMYAESFSQEFADLVGLYDKEGLRGDYDWPTSAKISIGNYEATSLSSLNDNTEVTPQEIGAYLQTVIEGGKETPFKPLESYGE